MRFSIMALFISARLAWGRLLSPILIPGYLTRIFPTPKKTVYKESLANYFFKN